MPTPFHGEAATMIKRLLFTLLTAMLLTNNATGQDAPKTRAAKPPEGLAIGAGLKCIGKLPVRRSNDINGSRWGVSCHWLADKHELSVEKRLDQLAALGAKWAFLVPDWDRIETEKGKYQWNSAEHQLDDAVHGMVKRKITPIIQIYGGNRLYMPFVPDPNVRPLADAAKLIGDPKVRGPWHRFLEAMVRRYKDQVKVWEIWNEPNFSGFWMGKASVAQYGQIVHDAAATIRRVQPRATILAGSTANVPFDFIEGFLASKGADAFDHWSVHPYGELPEQRDAPIRRVKEFLTSRGKSPVLWQSECGFPSSGDTGGWGYGGPWNETKHAKWVLRRLLSDAALGMPVSIYFVLNDYPSIYETGGSGPKHGKMATNRKGLYRWKSWQPKLAAHAFRHLAGLIDNRLEPKPLDVTINVTDNGSFKPIKPESVRTFTLVDKSTGAPMILYWLPVAIQTAVRPATISMRIDSGKMREPVLVDLLDGRVYDLSAKITTDGKSITLAELPLGDSPLAVCDRAAVTAGVDRNAQ